MRDLCFATSATRAFARAANKHWPFFAYLPPLRPTGFSPTGAVSDTTPTIRATVVDLQELLEGSDLEVRVDNDPRNFSYKANSGALSLAGGRMKEGRHSVEITAADPADPQNPATTKRWTFRVVE